MLVGIRGDGCQATVTPIFLPSVLSSNWSSYHPVTVKNEGSNPFNIANLTKGNHMKDLVFYFILVMLVIFIVSPEQIRIETTEHLRAVWDLLIYQKVGP